MNEKRKSEIENYRFKPGFPHEIEMVSLKTILDRSRNMMTQPHRAEFYHVIWFQKGKAAHLVDLHPIPIQANSLLFIGKGRVHMFDRISDYDGIVLLFTDAFFCRNPEDAQFLQGTPLFNVFNASPLVSLGGDAPEFAARFKQLETELAADGDKYQHLVLQNLLRNILISAERLAARNADADGIPSDAKRTQGARTPGSGDDKEYAHKFLRLVDQEFRSSKRVLEYADKIAITEKRLQKAVSRMYGKAAKDCIDERIILEAKRSLLFENGSVKEITIDLGFDEPTNFIKWFRKHAGQTPARFRARYLGGPMPDLPL